MTYATLTYLDYSNELSRTRFYVQDLDAGNYTAVVAEIQAIQNAVNALSNGAPSQLSWTAENILYPYTLPTMPESQREIKALVSYADNVTGNRYQMTIPVFNYDGVQQSTDVIDLTQGGWGPFVTEFEFGGRSPVGNPVTVLSAVLVGRRS